jgi:hypothetical protein
MLRLRGALTRRDERTREVLLTSYLHFDQTSGEFQLPDEVRDALCKQWNFKNGNSLVKFRSRKIDELRALLACAAQKESNHVTVKSPP